MSVSVRHDVVILACAVSAGVHAALAAGHAAESPAGGVAFAGAAAATALAGVALTRRPASGAALAVAAAALAGVVAAYGLAVTAGLPLVHPEREPVSGLALTTTAIEALGAAVAWSLLRGGRATSRRAPRPVPLALTALVGCFGALTALAVSSGGHP